MAAGSGAPSPRRKADAAALRGAGATKAGHAEASGAGGTLADEPGSRPPSPKAWRGRRGDRGQTGRTTDKRLATTLAQEWESQAFVQEARMAQRGALAAGASRVAIACVECDLPSDGLLAVGGMPICTEPHERSAGHDIDDE